MSETDNVAYFRKWAADIRDNHGPSVDADQIEAAANELAKARERLARATEIMTGLITGTDEETLRGFEVRARFFLRPEEFIDRLMEYRRED
jgi:hypothetical protein